MLLTHRHDETGISRAPHIGCTGAPDTPAELDTDFSAFKTQEGKLQSAPLLMPGWV